MSVRSFLPRWIGATWLGWILGVPLIALMALAGEAVGIGGSQVLVGIGMGAGVGLLQGRLVRGILGRGAPWFWSCVVGLAVPFLAWDVAKLAGRELPYSVFWAVAVGGLIAGAWQAALLRAAFTRAGWWVLGSFAAWGLAAFVASLADTLSRTQGLRGLVGALAYLGLVSAGGLVLGLVGAVTLKLSGGIR